MNSILLLGICVVFIILATTRLSLHPFLALFGAALGFGILSGMPFEQIVESINGGFGGTLSSIGIIIIFGTIIGTFLENSGGAYAIAEKTLRIVGEKRIPFAMSIIGYLVSIPVFADSGFIILHPLNKALSRKGGVPLAVSTIALCLGLMTTHCLIPPTPGPIAGAGILGADLGLVILLGIPVSMVSLGIGLTFALTYAPRFSIDSGHEPHPMPARDTADAAPSALSAFLPIIVPIVLIVLKSVSDLPSHPLGSGSAGSFFGFVGEPIIALFIGVLFAFTLPKRLDRKLLSVSGWVGTALLNAAIIIMITGAGGAFGRVLQNSGIAEVIGDTLTHVNIGIWLPFILASAIKTSQGSSTVAIILTSSLLAPLLGTLGFDSATGRALVVLAIGAGSMSVSHANDSMFWVLTQMTGMTVKTGYQLWTFGTLLVGWGSAFGVWILSLMLMN